MRTLLPSFLLIRDEEIPVRWNVQEGVGMWKGKAPSITAAALAPVSEVGSPWLTSSSSAGGKTRSHSGVATLGVSGGRALSRRRTDLWLRANWLSGKIVFCKNYDLTFSRLYSRELTDPTPVRNPIIASSDLFHFNPLSLSRCVTACLNFYTKIRCQKISWVLTEEGRALFDEIRIIRLIPTQYLQDKYCETVLLCEFNEIETW